MIDFEIEDFVCARRKIFSTSEAKRPVDCEVRGTLIGDDEFSASVSVEFSNRIRKRRIMKNDQSMLPSKAVGQFAVRLLKNLGRFWRCDRNVPW